MADENMNAVEQYDPNPYDNVTVEEALKQLFNRFTPRTVRQAIFTMAEAGGSDAFFINLTHTKDSGDLVCDKTCDEIAAAYKAGKFIYLNADCPKDLHNFATFENVLYNAHGNTDGELQYLLFHTMYQSEGMMYFVKVNVYIPETGTVPEITFEEASVEGTIPD